MTDERQLREYRIPLDTGDFLILRLEDEHHRSACLYRESNGERDTLYAGYHRYGDESDEEVSKLFYKYFLQNSKGTVCNRKPVSLDTLMSGDLS